jgi:hypothetical protein
VFTLLGSLQLGRGWEIGARLRLTSGTLYTPIVCDPAEAGCNQRRINGVYHGPTGSYVPLPAGGDYSERLPLFHQLDVRVEKRWKFKRWQLSMYVDIQNIYNAQPAQSYEYDYNYTRRGPLSGLPILPSLGVRGEL